MEVRARSKAARKVWDTADKFTRDTLGFSVLHVVRDNPTSIIASGVHYHHPDGVLYLTQFTQVAMATVAAAQVAEMREQGAFVEGAIACGHSVGEYTALACVTGIYQLEALLEMVFHRGSKMHDIVPRDELGRSNYRLAAIRPSQIDLDDADVPAFVAGIAESTGEFLEIVNFNLRGSQYAIAGTVRGLEALEAEVERRRELTGGRRSFILVPGIDVPFHSRVLRVGVAEFRRSLDRVMPRDADPDLIIGRYIPNLVPRLFTLTATSSRKSGIWCPPSRSTRSSPTTTPGFASVRARWRARCSSSCWHGNSPARCAGSRRRICCSSRRPPAGWVWSDSSRSV